MQRFHAGFELALVHGVYDGCCGVVCEKYKSTAQAALREGKRGPDELVVSWRGDNLGGKCVVEAWAVLLLKITKVRLDGANARMIDRIHPDASSFRSLVPRRLFWKASLFVH